MTQKHRFQNGRREGTTGLRAGAIALSLLAQPLNVAILNTLASGPRSLVELRSNAGTPPPTTMRTHMRELAEAGVLSRLRRNGFPGNVECELTSAGCELLQVADFLGEWLAGAPSNPLELGTEPSKSAIKALTAGWSSTLVRALAARPLSLTELSRLIAHINYPALERRLGAMRMVGQIEASPGSGRSRPYLVTDWLRGSVGPLAAAARWEKAHRVTGARPVGRLDAEAALLLVVPKMRLPAHLSGVCRLAVELQGRNGQPRLAGVTARIEEGRVGECVTDLDGGPNAWAVGSDSSWLAAVLEGGESSLELGGDETLARSMVDGLHARQTATARL